MEEGKTTRVPLAICPRCGYILDAATATEFNPEASPEPGDVTICVKCRSVLIFDAKLIPRKPTHEELGEIIDALIIQMPYLRLDRHKPQ